MDLLYSYIQLPSVGTEKRKKKEKTGNSNRREETVIKKDKSRNVKNGKRIDHISLTFHSRLHLFAFPHLRVFLSFFVSISQQSTGGNLTQKTPLKRLLRGQNNVLRGVRHLNQSSVFPESN